MPQHYSYTKDTLSGSRIARIALKTSANERSHFFTSKLYPTFLFNSEKKLFLRSKKKSEIFLGNFSKSEKHNIFIEKSIVFSLKTKTQIFGGRVQEVIGGIL